MACGRRGDAPAARRAARAGRPSGPPRARALPTQSAPVSPPPITTTSLPVAVIWLPRGRRLGFGGGAELAGHPAVALVEVVHREVHAVELAAGDGQVARHARAGRQHDRVEAAAQLRHADVAARRRRRSASRTPSATSCSTRRCTTRLLDLEVGHAEAHEPADRLVALEQRHGVAAAAQLLGRGHARPARTRRPRPTGRFRGRGRGCGATQPSSQARLMIAFSICLIVTASPSRISSTHAASHGAGHSRPVNSGKLLVACSCAIASSEAVAVDEVVPVRDQVAQRAAVVAEGHPAVHAAGALLAQLRLRPREQELAGSPATRSTGSRWGMP